MGSWGLIWIPHFDSSFPFATQGRGSTFSRSGVWRLPGVPCVCSGFALLSSAALFWPWADLKRGGPTGPCAEKFRQVHASLVQKKEKSA